MVANQATIAVSTEDIVSDMISRIDSLAQSGDWNRIDSLTNKLRGTILDVPVAERASAIKRLSHCLERVQSKAHASRVELKDKLSEIRRGRVATAAYGQPARPEPQHTLR